MAGRNKGPGLIGMGRSEFRRGGTIKSRKAEPTEKIVMRRDAVSSKIRRETQPINGFATRARKSKSESN